MSWRNEGSGATIDFLRWFLYVGLGWYVASANHLEVPWLIGIIIAFVLDHCSGSWYEMWKEDEGKNEQT